MGSPNEIVGTVLDGKLRIDRALASGAAGDVYEALHLGLNTRVAVKVLRPGGGETASIRRKRFLREARVAAQLRSPHVVRVYDVTADARGTPYIVMELLRGETLAERLARTGPLPVAEAVAYVRQGARALAEMHDAGMVHRDVKPSNLFLATDDGGDVSASASGDRKPRDPTVKLLDFGIAALQQPIQPPPSDSPRESSITFSEAFVGTPRYVAPEQVRSSKDVDARADVWALAVTLHELLAGSPPFDGATVLAVLNQIERGEPPVIERLRPEVPPGLGAFLRGCMARDPDARPADARAFADGLAPFDASDRPITPIVVVAHSRRPRRVAVIAGAIAATAILVVVGLRRPGDAEPREEPPPATSAATVPPMGAGSLGAPNPGPSAPTGLPASAIGASADPPPQADAPVATAPSVASISSPQPTLPSRARSEAIPPRPRPRPAAAKPVGTSRPTRPTPENDDRIE